MFNTVEDLKSYLIKSYGPDIINSNITKLQNKGILFECETEGPINHFLNSTTTAHLVVKLLQEYMPSTLTLLTFNIPSRGYMNCICYLCKFNSMEQIRSIVETHYEAHHLYF